MKILGLKAENVKRLRAVEIQPDPSAAIIEIAGENEQGKTSLFDAIRMAIGGAKATPEVPVRRGETAATCVLDLGDLVVEFWTDGTDRKVVVRDADGKKQAKPQDILNRLYSKVAFDPLEFSRQKPEVQAATLKKLVGLDFSDLDANRSKLYEERTRMGYARRIAEDSIPALHTESRGAETAEVDVAALMAEKEKADAVNRHVAELIEAQGDAAVTVDRLRRELAKAEADLAKLEAAVAAAPQPIETSGIVERIKGAEDINRKVRAAKDRAKAVEVFKARNKEFEELTEKIAAIDAEKARQLAAAPFPIPGLGFGDVGITVDGLPFEQASKAQRMKVSLAIGAALNPELRVMLLEDASLLDKSSRAIVEQVAREKDLQVWIEVVGEGGPGAIIIEDGMVATNLSTDI